MANSCTATTLAQSFSLVKPVINNQLPLFPDSMIHHNPSLHTLHIIHREKGSRCLIPYGVSSSRRILSPGLFSKRHHLVKQALTAMAGLTPKQAEVAERILRLQIYYGNTYPKAEQVAGEYHATAQQVAWRAEFGLPLLPRRGDIGRATFWRTIGRLRDRGLITVINRYIFREHAQISNLYRLDRLLLLIARYLAEHGTQFWQSWLQPYLVMPGAQFWGAIWPSGASRDALASSLPLLPGPG